MVILFTFAGMTYFSIGNDPAKTFFPFFSFVSDYWTLSKPLFSNK